MTAKTGQSNPAALEVMDLGRMKYARALAVQREENRAVSQSENETPRLLLNSADTNGNLQGLALHASRAIEHKYHLNRGAIDVRQLHRWVDHHGEVANSTKAG